MKTHFFAIDESGRFDVLKKNKSFVCGVSIPYNKNEVIEVYKKAYKLFNPEREIPNNVYDIIKHNQFHFMTTNYDREKFPSIFLPLTDCIYVSLGKPALCANNQNWWLVGVTAVISEYLRTHHFETGDVVNILIDRRASKVFGIDSNEVATVGLVDQEAINERRKNQIGRTEEQNNVFDDYHNRLIIQIKSFIQKWEVSLGISVQVIFANDTNSFFVNLADITTGIISRKLNLRDKKVIECPCCRFICGDDPTSFVSSNPLVALTLIFQEVANSQMQDVGLIKGLLQNISHNTDDYIYAWDMFYDLLKDEISLRTTGGNLTGLKVFVNIFLQEFMRVRDNDDVLQSSKRIELVILFVEYFSHIGETGLPFSQNVKGVVLDALRDSNENSETRLLRKWEKYISFSLRDAQIKFNAYDFDSAVKELNDLWACQEKITNDVPRIFGNTDVNKDEPTAAIIGTLAQSYAYVDNFDKAREDFEYSKDYAITTTSKTASYLFTIYHRQRDIANARECFKEQSGKSPEDYDKICDFKNVWILLSYCKLRALELYVNNSTKLPAVDLTKLDSYNSEYPFPLIQKWEGIAKWIENSSSNKAIVEKYFGDAIENLLNGDNGFVIKTLALPIIQCYALVNNQNKFHAKYNFILDDLKKQSPFFKKYVDSRAVSLNSLKNKEDIWNRAMLLPFIYA